MMLGIRMHREMYWDAFPDWPLCPGALGFGAEDQKPTLDEAVKGVVEKVEDRG